MESGGDLTRLSPLADLVAAKRLEATRRALGIPDFASWPPETPDGPTFSTLVTESYKWFREAWGQEIKFLGDHSRELRVNAYRVFAFSRSIAVLRTAQQHTDNPEAVRDSEGWFREACGSPRPDSRTQWIACGVRLMEQAEHALETLLDLA